MFCADALRPTNRARRRDALWLRLLSGVKAVTVRYMSVVRRCCVIARFVMLCGLDVVLRRVPVMLCRFLVVFRALVI